MIINIENSYPTVPLATADPGDVFARVDAPETFYIVIRPDYKLNNDAGIYCVELKSGELYCFSGERRVIPVSFEGTATF